VLASSALASVLCLGRGILVTHVAKQPPLPLRLYDFEACPFCRMVREALTALHLDVEIKPCPRNGQRFRPEAIALGGKRQFPLLVDPNTDTLLYESRDILAYLFRTYGRNGQVPVHYRAVLSWPLLGALASAVRLGRGRAARPSRMPAKPLSLYSFEGSPFARLVRERMTELELPYTLHNLGKERWGELGTSTRRLTRGPYVPRPGGKRQAFLAARGRVQVPYLEDPNTGAALFESSAIIEYLERTYAL
jgi:glutathione S-transferase